MIIFLLALSLIIVCVLKPQVHKPVSFELNYKPVFSFDTKEVEWNTWHSTVVNKLLNDAKTAPANQSDGTINTIEFDVDDKQNIMNIRIYSEPQKYSRLAKKHFDEVVLGLDGSSVLKFPSESQRKIVHFKAVFKTGKLTKLSSPDDFGDYETVRFKR